MHAATGAYVWWNATVAGLVYIGGGGYTTPHDKDCEKPYGFRFVNQAELWDACRVSFLVVAHELYTTIEMAKWHLGKNKKGSL